MQSRDRTEQRQWRTETVENRDSGEKRQWRTETMENKNRGECGQWRTITVDNRGSEEQRQWIIEAVGNRDNGEQKQGRIRAVEKRDNGEQTQCRLGSLIKANEVSPSVRDNGVKMLLWAYTGIQGSNPYQFGIGVANVSKIKAGVDGTVNSHSALRSARPLLSQVRAPPSTSWPDGGPESLRFKYTYNHNV
ncbi:hypothetical protein PoB_007486600 [Plakobranchus ocellatus]|uniref:Uncharacterized protein n=1 Tax=Plakobranchus ocellatus TaxID=259542 RepID=A0AAV4DWZ6_9GAST|nr:hypothetical protein PoB_007486600 [Plakobranchus ocellatus]